MSILNPPPAGEYRVFNQFTEIFSVLQLAELVKKQAARAGLPVEIHHLENPRVESEEHYYHARHQKLIELGLVPHQLSDVLLESTFSRIRAYAHRVKKDIILPKVHWNEEVAPRQIEESAWLAQLPVRD